MGEFLDDLKKQEMEALTKVIAFMSYNPSIGRVLEKGGVIKFQKLAVKLVSELNSVRDLASFDNLHHIYVRKMIKNFETAHGKRLSYGQGQKPINVFLKVYVDWAGKPNHKVRRNLLRKLHVPLDSSIMKSIRREYKDWYEKTIKPQIKDHSQPFSLSKMNKTVYMKWQALFREKHPSKPLIFDIAWAINR